MGPARALYGLGRGKGGGLLRSIMMNQTKATGPPLKRNKMVLYRAIVATTAPSLTSARNTPLVFARSRYAPTTTSPVLPQRRSFSTPVSVGR